MAKVNFLNKPESFMSERYISQLHGNAHKKNQKKMKVLYLGSNEKKKSGKALCKTEARFTYGR